MLRRRLDSRAWATIAQTPHPNHARKTATTPLMAAAGTVARAWSLKFSRRVSITVCTKPRELKTRARDIAHTTRRSSGVRKNAAMAPDAAHNIAAQNTLTARLKQNTEAHCSGVGLTR